MIKESRKLFHVILIALVAWLTLAPAARAAYTYNMKVTVDHTRVVGLDAAPPSGFSFLKSIAIDHTQVAGTNVTPPSGFGYVKRITIDYTKVGGSSDLTDFPVLVSIKNETGLKTTVNGGRVTDDEGDDLVFYAADLTTRLDYEVEQFDGAAGTLVAWVRLPLLEAEVDTVFYLAYGNGSITSSQANPAGVWDSNFKGVWHLDEDQADTGNIDLYTDSTGNGNHGDDEVSATGQEGQIGAGQEFDGTDDYVGMGDVLFYGKNDPVSYSAWIKANGAPVQIAGRANQAGNWHGVWFYIEADGTFCFFIYDSNGNELSKCSENRFNDSQWHHVAATYDGSDSANGITLYGDGSELVIIYGVNGTLGTVNNSYPFNIGAANDGAGYHFNGNLDEVRLSSTARSAGWIETEFNNQSDPDGFMTIEDSGSLVDFPMLVSIPNDPFLKTTANGGRVTDPQGDDLVFYASDLTTRLDYEVEQYDGTAGTLVAWVRLPALASDVDTVFYLAYGNSGISSSLANPTGVWDSNFKGVWHLEEEQADTGNNALYTDSTQHANHGDDEVSATGQEGKIAAGQQFDGSNDYISLQGRDIEDHDYDAVTMQVWYKSSDSAVSDDQYIYNHHTNDWNDHISFGPTDDGVNADRVRVSIGDGGTLGPVYGTTDVVDQQWHHIVMVRTGGGAGSKIKIYVDGVEEANGIDPSGGGVIALSASDLGPFIGDSPGDTEQVFGLLDELRVSSTARSAAWITTEYNNQNNPGGFMTIIDNSPPVDFPVLVSIQNDAQLKTTANGGQVTDAEGDDIIFTSDVDGASKLDHEVEFYDGATGTLAAWVRLPTLSVTQDTAFYLHYGNSAVNSSQENVAGVWDSNFRGVYHLVESGDGTVSEFKDSSGSGNHGRGGNGASDQVPKPIAAGMVGSAQDFDGTNDWIYLGPVLPTPSNISAATISAWVKHEDLTNAIERHVDMGGDIVIRHDAIEGQLDFYIRDTDDVSLHLRVPVVLTDDTWYHVAGTWDGTTQRVFLNGQLMGSHAPEITLYLDGLGKASAAAETMNGIIDEVRVSDTARSAGWIETTYNNQQWPNKAQYPTKGFIRVERAVCDIANSATPVTCGSTTAGSIETPGAWDAFEVTLGADTWIDIYTTGTTDTYGHLYDSDCVEIAQDDTVDYNFMISQAVAAGTYYVQVRHASEFDTGDYELSVECGKDDHGDNIDDATPMDCNSSIGGSIESGGDEDYFKVVFWGTGVLTAYSTDGVDPNGTLLDEAGNFIAADDNSGGGNQFEIVRTVGPGVYYVAVRETDPAQTSDYRLHVTCEYTPVITATAEYGGTISPAGSVGVPYDGAQTFTITPAAGSTVRDVWVDGVWVGAVSSYEFKNVQADHKIVAVFNADFENCVDIPDIPLDAWYRSAPANVMFVLDDSGSMDWEFMTIASDGLFDNYYRYVFDDPGDNLYGRVLPTDQRMKWRSQWAGYNKLYYDPTVDYHPWPNHVAGEAAQTLAPAHPDTPRSHPMDAGTTFDLNGTYCQYTSSTKEIIVNDQDSGFSKTPEAAGDETLLSTGFEGKKTWDDGFTNNGTTKWKPDNKQDHGGKQSVMADKKKGGSLTSDNLDAGDLGSGDSITVEFWFRKNKVKKNNEFILEYYDGNSYDFIVDFKSVGKDKKWIHYQDTITDTQYFKSDFRIRLRAALKDKKGKVWVDDLVIKKNGGGGGWELATGSDQAYDPTVNGDYWWTGTDGDYTATWTPDIPEAGDYDVYARWQADDNRSQNVPYTINYNGGSYTATVDQRLNGGKWVLLGTFPFAAGTGGEDVTKVDIKNYPQDKPQFEFDPGETFRGKDSGATAEVVSVQRTAFDTATVTIKDVSGTFTSGEAIKSTSSNHAADLDGLPYKEAGKGGNVSISYTRNGDDDRVCADAIKFAPAGAVDNVDIKRAHYYTWSESEGKPYLVVLDGAIAYYKVTDANSNHEIESGEITIAAKPPADVQTGRSYAQERQNFANWYQFYRRRELSATAAVANVIAGLEGVQVGFYSINGNLVQPVLPIKSSGIDKSKNLLQSLYGLKIKPQGTPLRRGLREVGKYFADASDMIGSSPYATDENGGACQQAFAILMTDGFWNGSNPNVGNNDGDDNTTYDGGGYADIYSDTLADVAMEYYENDLHTGLDDNIPTSPLDTAAHQHMVTYAVSFGRVGSLNPDDYDIENGVYPTWPDPRYVGEHKIDDLWHAAVNGRGEFLNAASPRELVDSLLAISRSILGRIASSSSVSVNGDPLYKELDDHTQLYQATYRSDIWTGNVHAYRIDALTGDIAPTPEWSAADRLETLDWDTDRIIATYDGSQGIPFRYDRDVLSIGQQTALGSDLVPNSDREKNAVKILNYLRGDRSNEEQNGGAFRERFGMLGDIVHSSPVHHDGMLYAGGNDGMLHAFDTATLDERFAYVPNLVFGNLSYLVDPRYSHKYFVDLSPTIVEVTLGGQAKSVLVGGLGKGGRGYYALDITNPAAITDEDELASRVLWEFPDPKNEGRGNLAFDSRIENIAVGDIIYTQGKLAYGAVADIPVADGNTGILSLLSVGGAGRFQDGDDLYSGAGVKVARADGGLYDPYMGYSYSRPVIVKSNDPSVDWLVIFGNGYNSFKSHAALYILNLATGELVKRIDTGVGNCNGLSSPIAIDIDFNGTADYVYAGDLQGNLWKFDLFDTDAANWEAAYEGTSGNPAPVFQAKNFGGHPQPITSKPDVMYHCSKPGYMVIFGTGRYLTELDLDSTESSSIYGIWDYGDDDDNREYLGSFERSATPQLSNPHLDGEATRARVTLLEQTVEPGTYTTTYGQSLRILTDRSPNWGTVADNDMGQSDPQPDPGSAMTGDTVHAGWYFDLPNVGERAVSDVLIRDGKVLVISFTPGEDPCGFGGDSIFHALDACTGGRPNRTVFLDVNEFLHSPVSGGETTISQDDVDWKEVSGKQFSGRLQPPVILRDGNVEYYYLSSSTGEVHKQNAAATRMGIFYWMQVE